MPFWSNIFNTKAPESYISATVPLVSDVSRVQYPEDNYGNFAKEGYGRSAIVHACIRELSIGLASPRYYVGVPSPDGGVVEVDNTPLAKLIKKPNPNQDFYHWIERLNTYLQVAGNAYIYKTRNRGNQVDALWLLRPDRVKVKPHEMGENDYTYEVDGQEYQLEGRDVGHITFPNPSNDTYGLSPLHVLAKTVNLDMTMTDFAKMYFQNAGVPSGLLKVKRRLNNQEEANRIRSRWRSSFGGSNNMHTVAILDDDAEYQPMAANPNAMALTELHNHTESRICSVFGVPPILISANVGIARSTFANYKEARMSFHSETLEPLIARIIRYLNYCLLPDFQGQGEILADLSGTRAFLDDKETMATRAINLFAGGLITLNEAREMQGLEAMDNGDVRRIPSALSEVAEGMEVPSLSLPFVEDSAPHPELKASVAPRARQLKKTMDENRERLTDSLEKDMANYYRRMQNRIDGIMGRNMERGADESKDFPFSFDDLIPEADYGDLSEILYRSFLTTAKQTFTDINASGVAGILEWGENINFVSATLTEAPARAKIIHSTTRKHITKMLDIGLERGYSVEQLARGVPDEKFAGLKSLMKENLNRARLTARTEVMRTQNLTSVNFYKAQGFEYVRAYDPDGDPRDTYVPAGDPYGRTCIERHMQVYRADDARDIEDHPNGTLSWQPMPRNYQPEGVTV